MNKRIKKNFKESLPEKIIAIDTSTRRGSVALYLTATGEMLEFTADTKKVHAERLLPAIDFILNQSGFSVKEIDLIAVATGPGSFTGLRIGLATAKGLSFSSGIPIKGVSSFEVLANRVSNKGSIVCPLIEAGRSQIYYALFNVNKFRNIKKIYKESCGKIDEIINLLKDKKNIVFAGNAIDKYKNEIKNNLCENIFFASNNSKTFSAISVAEYALEKIKSGEDIDDSCLISPYYIRPSDAEENNAKVNR